MGIYRIVAVVFWTLVALSTRAEAQPGTCGGFTDISPGGGFCTNVLWMKNRGITLGCTPTLYCWANGVSRRSMAAFMNRLGNTLTPKVFSIEENGGVLDFSTYHVVCQTPELPAPAGNYPRFVDAEGSLSFEVSGLQTLIVVPVVSKDGGSWQAMGQSIGPYVGPGMRHNASTVAPGFLIFDGGGTPPISLKFGLAVSRQNQFNQTITSWACHLEVMVRNGVYNGY
jgi:hypothetical protein